MDSDKKLRLELAAPCLATMAFLLAKKKTDLLGFLLTAKRFDEAYAELPALALEMADDLIAEANKEKN